MFFCYIARCSDESLYVGSCADLRLREVRHNAGAGALYTKYRRPVRIVYSESFASRKDAVKREMQIKKWRREKKENLIKFGHPNGEINF
ncbi:hypothetical protein CSB37_00760 [bacterium DOLZORAL124_38_8]|nr:MAG: hypothetical protein CSB37_00760 [bacterium DOLZORAL124_38_8]